MHVHDVGARDRGRERPRGSARAAATEPRRSARSTHAAAFGAAPTSTGPGSSRARPPGARRMRHVLDRRRPRSRAQSPELPRQQRVGGLIGRQVRRDVQDAHAVSRGSTARRNSANVTGAAPSSRVANARKRSSRSQNASSSPCVRLYGLPPTMASLEWNSRFSTGSPRPRERRAPAPSSRRATSTTAAASASGAVPAPAARAWSCTGRGARA